MFLSRLQICRFAVVNRFQSEKPPRRRPTFLQLRYNLGAAGERAIGDNPSSTQPLTRKWSQLRPLAGAVLDKCLDHWQESIKVQGAADRFCETFAPSWCPSPDLVHQCMAELDPRTKPVKQSTSRLLAAAANQKLCRFWSGTSSSTLQQPTCAVIALVPGGRPKLSNGHAMFVCGEVVNRSARLLRAEWRDHRVILKRPWEFLWAVDLFVETVQDMTDGCAPVSIVAFPNSWRPSGDLREQRDLLVAARSGIEGCLRSRKLDSPDAKADLKTETEPCLSYSNSGVPGSLFVVTLCSLRYLQLVGHELQDN